MSYKLNIPGEIITSGSIADARVPASAVTQHESSLDLEELNISADLDMGSYAVESSHVPDSGNFLTNKTYVDAYVQGLMVKKPVKLVATANVNLANGLEAGDTIDGVNLATNDRVLLVGQTDASENGIYAAVATGAGAADRDDDMDASTEITSGMTFFVTHGTAKAGTTYVLTTLGAVVLDTTDLTFTQLSSATEYTHPTSAGNKHVPAAGSGNQILTYASAGTAAWSSTFTGNVTGDLTGKADTADTLETARAIGGVNFDGSAAINLPGVNASGNQNTSGSAATLTTARAIGGVNFDGSAAINLPGVNATGSQDTTGSAATLTTARAIGGVNFDGSAAINLPGVNAAGNQNTSGTAAGLSATLAVGSGGTGQTSAGTAMLNALAGLSGYNAADSYQSIMIGDNGDPIAFYPQEVGAPLFLKESWKSATGTLTMNDMGVILADAANSSITLTMDSLPTLGDDMPGANSMYTGMVRMIKSVGTGSGSVILAQTAANSGTGSPVATIDGASSLTLPAYAAVTLYLKVNNDNHAITVTVAGTPANGDTFDVTINGTEFVHTAQTGSLTVSNIAAALTTLIQASGAVNSDVSAASTLGVITITSDDNDETFDVSIDHSGSTNGTLATNTSVNARTATSANWYIL
jgi:hypothetical protein